MYDLTAAELESAGIEVLPANLLDATRELERDEVIRAGLGRAVDEDYADYYIRVKRREWASYHEQVTPWEVERYLTLT
jgi:glutamine synthetase